MTLRPGNPMTRVLVVLLVFEIVVFLLAIPGMIQVDDRSVGLSIGIGGAAMALAGAAAATLRRPVGWVLAWATQVVAVALGLPTPWMYAMGALFALLWAVSFVLGKRLERANPGRDRVGA